MERVEVWLDDRVAGDAVARVGELTVSEGRARRVVRFRYDVQWIAPGRRGFALDPELPIGAGDYFPRPGVTLHGAFRDIAPDRWGRRLMDRRERNCRARRPVAIHFEPT